MLQFYIPEIKGVEQAKLPEDEVAEKEFHEMDKKLGDKPATADSSAKETK
jgi:hypothetical protein